MSDHVLLLRTGNVVTVEPTTPRVRDLLVPHLTFYEKVWLRGRDAALARRQRRATVVSRPWELYADDHKGRITTPYGFTRRIARVLHNTGIVVRIKNLTPPPDPSVFEPRWDLVFDGQTELKYKQDQLLIKMCCHDQGRFDCPTGWGKTFMIGLACVMWPGAHIAVVTRSSVLLREQIFPELCQMVGDVGIITHGARQPGRRIMCYTSGSLHHLVAQARSKPFDVIFYDEVHEAAADETAYQLALIPGQPRMYGFSATQDMRADGKDARVEGLFGEVLLRVGYEEARAEGMVSRMRVIVRKVVMDVDPCADFEDVDKNRHGLWANGYRNRMVIEDALAYPDDQVMVYCATIEHLLHLRKLANARGVDLPLVYSDNELPPERVRRLRRMGLPIDEVPPMTRERLVRLMRDIRRGTLRLFAANPVIKVGLDARQIAVVVRADGGSSRITDNQTPGRASRTFKGKDCGVVHDYLDLFNVGMAMRSQSRLRSYRSLGWKVKVRQRSEGELAKRMHWED